MINVQKKFYQSIVRSLKIYLVHFPCLFLVLLADSHAFGYDRKNSNLQKRRFQKMVKSILEDSFNNHYVLI